MKKHLFIIIINNGKITKTPLTYSYGSTKDIELHLSNGKAVIRFYQDSKRQPDVLLTSKDNLCTDAIKKALLFHLIRFGEPLDIKELGMSVDGSITSVFHRTAKEEPLVYSLVNNRLDRPLPDKWQDPAVLQTLIGMVKSCYDGRMNALIALLIAKEKTYLSEKAIYLWMSMNGFYNYLTEQVNTCIDSNSKKITQEWQQHQVMKAITGLPMTGKQVMDNDKTIIRRKTMSLLSNLEDTPETLYEKLNNGEVCVFGERLTMILSDYNASIPPLTFLTVWLPYQIRCSYFHNNQAMPLFVYPDEGLMKALQYTNFFVERYIEEKLPEYLTKKELTEEEKQRLYDQYHCGQA